MAWPMLTRYDRCVLESMLRCDTVSPTPGSVVYCLAASQSILLADEDLYRTRSVIRLPNGDQALGTSIEHTTSIGHDTKLTKRARSHARTTCRSHRLGVRCVLGQVRCRCHQRCLHVGYYAPVRNARLLARCYCCRIYSLIRLLVRPPIGSSN